MNIGILGSGNIGSGLAKHWSEYHRVMIGVRNIAKAQQKMAEMGLVVPVEDLQTTAAFAEVLVFALPFTAFAEVSASLGSLSNKILIDTSNPITRSEHGPAPALGQDTSGAEELAKHFPDCHVVKAFNSIFAQVIHKGPQFADTPASVFYCGDYAQAKTKVAQLAQEIGFQPIDIGPLVMARYLEPFTLILIRLQRQPGMSSDMGYTLLRR